MVTITRVRPSGRDEHGDAKPAGELSIDGWDVAPRTAQAGPASVENNDRGETVIVGLTIYGPFDADIRATDQVRLTGTAWDGLYDVVGEPGRWQNAFSGRKSGTEVALTRH